jgi:biopolymer transport protein TolR
MGMAGGDAGQGGRRFLGGSSGLDQINVTPFVDVVLVLLIIFMVTAPFAVSGVNIDLPRNNTGSITAIKDPVVVSVSSKGEFFFGEERVSQDQLLPTLKRIAELQKAEVKAIYIRADQSVPYGTVMRAMEAAKQAGFGRIGMMGKTSQ